MKEKFKLNLSMKNKQLKNVAVLLAAVILMISSFILMNKDKHANQKSETVDLTGVTSGDFSEKNVESAMTAQQEELTMVQAKLEAMTKALNKLQEGQNVSIQGVTTLAKAQDVLNKRAKVLEARVSAPPLTMPPAPKGAQAYAIDPEALKRAYPGGAAAAPQGAGFSQAGTLSSQSFSYGETLGEIEKTPATYVPSGAYVEAVILGGTDADASVTGENKQNVMLFKLLDRGTLPNHKQSHLKGCFLTAGAYGDISSERAFVHLDHISCVRPGQPIMDEKIEGWAFYHGKNGIKGIPLMRDDKVLTWAGLSGAMAGFADAMQYAQTTQSISALGSTTTVDNDAVLKYGAYGGASTSLDRLSDYYIKRAEQYHPVIQVGAGNKVTIVFQTGFYIVPHDKNGPIALKTGDGGSHVKIPPQILNQMKNVQLGQPIGGTP